MSTTHSLAESDDGEEIDLGLDCFEEFKELYKRSWAHYKSKLLTDYVRAAYVLSPDLKVYDDARAIRDGGGHGSIIGRNSFQRPRDEALVLLQKLVDIYKGKA